MAENSKIEWCDHTFNPWVGCTKVSPACDHCYAEGWAKRTGQANLWAGERRRTTAANWQQPLKWNRQAEREGRRFRVFCASLADVFDNQVPAEWRVDLWKLIRDTPALDWLLLTKRPQNIAKMLPGPAAGYDTTISRLLWLDGWPNVWLGTTVENQAEADRRIPHLLAVPAAVHFLSCEPLLGPVDLAPWWKESPPSSTYWHPNGLHWIIAGGESGPGARPMSIQWVRALRDQCLAAGTAFHFKQWGEWAPAGIHPSETPGRFAFGDYEHDPGRMIEVDHYPRQFTMFGARSVMERVGKKAAGRLLDGREHNGMPT
jgi:protein gp37